MRVRRAKYVSVLTRTIAVEESVIPDGERWEIQRFIGNGAYLPNVTVSLVWDRGEPGEEILAATHGDAEIDVLRVLVGDGVKKLEVVLQNDSNEGQTIGGSWTGTVLE